MTPSELKKLCQSHLGHEWQTELSRLIPYTRQYINLMANGHKPISNKVVFAVMAALVFKEDGG